MTRRRRRMRRRKRRSTARVVILVLIVILLAASAVLYSRFTDLKFDIHTIPETFANDYKPGYEAFLKTGQGGKSCA